MSMCESSCTKLCGMAGIFCQKIHGQSFHRKARLVCLYTKPCGHKARSSLRDYFQQVQADMGTKPQALATLEAEAAASQRLRNRS